MFKKYIHISYKISEWFTWFAMIAFVATALPQISTALTLSITSQAVIIAVQGLPLFIIMGCSYAFRIIDNQLIE